MDKMVNGEIVEMSEQESADFMASQDATDAEKVALIKQALIEKEKESYLLDAISVKITSIEAMNLTQLQSEMSK